MRRALTMNPPRAVDRITRLSRTPAPRDPAAAALQLLGLVVDDGLHDPLPVDDVVGVGGVAQAPERRFAVGLGELARPAGPVERTLDPLAARFEGALVDLPDADVETGPGAHLGDARAHQAAADHADTLDLAHRKLLTRWSEDRADA